MDQLTAVRLAVICDHRHAAFLCAQRRHEDPCEGGTSFGTDENVSELLATTKLFALESVIIQVLFTPYGCTERFTNCEVLGKAS